MQKPLANPVCPSPASAAGGLHYPGNAPAVAQASSGSVLWQEIPCNGITIRVQHYLPNKLCNFTCIKEEPVLKRLFQVCDHMLYQIDGQEQLTARQRSKE